MNEPVTLETLFSSEVVSRFLRQQDDARRQAFKACRSIKFDARAGAIVLECPNDFLANVMESRRFELEAIAAATGAQLQIVVAGKGKCYW